jgi:hypothetical protein
LIGKRERESATIATNDDDDDIHTPSSHHDNTGETVCAFPFCISFSFSSDPLEPRKRYATTPWMISATMR